MVLSDGMNTMTNTNPVTSTPLEDWQVEFNRLESESLARDIADGTVDGYAHFGLDDDTEPEVRVATDIRSREIRFGDIIVDVSGIWVSDDGFPGCMVTGLDFRDNGAVVIDYHDSDDMRRRNSSAGVFDSLMVVDSIVRVSDVDLCVGDVVHVSARDKSAVVRVVSRYDDDWWDGEVVIGVDGFQTGAMFRFSADYDVVAVLKLGDDGLVSSGE